MLRYILLLFVLFFSSEKISAQKIITIGIGYALDEKDRPFYVPIVVRNDAPEKIAAAVGEPIISLDGQNLAFYAEVMHDSVALIAKKKELATLFGTCSECIFRTVNPATRELRIFDGYPSMFRYATDMDPFFMQEDKLKGNELGFLGFSYKMQLKPNTLFAFRPVIQEVKPASPAEKAGLKVGDELSSIIFSDGIKESLYNTPLLWIIQKMKGPVGTSCTLVVNETETKILKRANLSGDLKNPQIINNCLSGDCKEGIGKLDNGKDIYEGGFVHYKYEGKGKLYRNERLAFEGTFLEGQKNGVGIDYQFDGTTVENSYTKGKSGNTLKYTKPNGFVYFEVWNGAKKTVYDKAMKALTSEELEQKMGNYKPSTSIAGNNPTEMPVKTVSTVTPPPPTNPAKTVSTPTKTATISTPPSAPVPTTNTSLQSICTHCKGTGTYKQYGTCVAAGCVNGNVICDICKGKGTYKDSKGKSKTCTHCQYVSAEMPHAQNCKTCSGTGMAMIAEKPCAFCKGTGKKQ